MPRVLPHPAKAKSVGGAVLVADPANDPEGKAFAAQMAAALLLRPDFLLLLGDVSRDANGRWRCDGRPFSLAGFPPAVPVYAFGNATGEIADRVLTLPGGFPLFLLRRADLRRGRGILSQWLIRRLRGIAPEYPVLLVWDAPPWSGEDPNGWETFEKTLFSLGRRVYILSAGVDRFTWWSQKNVSTFCLGPPRASRLFVGAGTTDGRVNGFLWLYASGGTIDFRVLAPEALLSPQVFGRQLQLEWATLSHAISATPIDPADPVTTVQCWNPTSQPLEFQAQWHFSDAAKTPVVDPQVLGFSLRPGQIFIQKFRFRYADGVPLKFLEPAFHARTEMADALGRRRPVEVTVRPVVRMGGRVIVLDKPIAVDGKLQDWPDEGAPINHPSQVTAGSAPWDGPDDLSGALHVGVYEQTLYVALRVHDDALDGTGKGHVCQGTIYVVRDPGDASGAVPAILTIGAVFGEGTRIRGGADYPIPSAVASAGKSDFVFEAAIPFQAFAGGLPANPLRVEAVVEEQDSGEEQKSLCFSGTLRALQSAKYYADFLWNP